MSTSQPLFELNGISKSFSGVRALENVNLSIFRGEVHALVGENGAGKSTLMKILSGSIPHGQFGGQILKAGESMHFAKPKDSEAAGVAIIHQELSAFPHLTVAENLAVGHWPSKMGIVDQAALKDSADRSLRRVGAGFSSRVRMGDLSTGDQQLVEIAKALSRDSQVLILDEPTSSLSPKESERLFALINELRTAGKALIYISHRMEEIFRLSERITVLRDGSSVHTALAKELDESSLIAKMVGRPLNALYPQRPSRKIGPESICLEGFRARAKQSVREIGPISFSARKGEIVGFGGLLGAGRSELFRAVIGDESYRISGEVKILDRPFHTRNPGSSYREGLAYLSEDRKRDSIMPTRTLTENASIQRLSLGGLAAYVNFDKETTHARESMAQLKTRFHSPGQNITDLSGGNQQKVILARILQTAPEILILDEPTRGVDVGAKYEIYEILFQLVEQNKTVILISSDLPELLAMSDRVIVMSYGKQRGEIDKHVNPEGYTQESVMKLAVEQG